MGGVHFVLGNDISADLASRVMKLQSFRSAVLLISLFGFPLGAIAQTRDLLEAGVMDAFREVETWRGVGEVAAVEGKPEFTISGQGKILVNSDRKEPVP